MQMFGLVLLILFGGVALIALLAAIHLLLPTPVEKARLKLEGALSRAFLLGLVDLLFFGFLTMGLFWLGQRIGGVAAAIFSALALLVLLALVLFAVNGLVALASLLGHRISATKLPFWSDIHGGLLLLLACLTPYIGWYVFAPFVLCVGLGASVLALLQRKPAPPLKA